MENQDPLLIQVIEEMPAEAKQLKWRKDEVSEIEHVTMMGLKVEIMVKIKEPVNYQAWVRTPMTNWQFLGDQFLYKETVKIIALETVAKQLTQPSHHLYTIANNFEQL